MNEYNKRFENFCTQIRSSAKGKTPLDLLSELDLALEEASLTGNEVDPALADAYIAIAQEMRELPPAPSGEELAEHFWSGTAICSITLPTAPPLCPASIAPGAEGCSVYWSPSWLFFLP